MIIYNIPQKVNTITSLSLTSFLAIIILVFYLIILIFLKNINIYYIMNYLTVIFIVVFSILYLLTLLKKTMLPLSAIYCLAVLCLLGLSIILSANIIYKRKLYYALLLSTICLLLGAFSTNNIIVFYFFFELALIPVFLIIIIWGSRPEKSSAAYQFFLYTILGSFCLLLGIIYLVVNTQTTNMHIIESLYLPLTIQNILFLLFFIGFAVKIPLFPFHLWLPKAHVEAPTVGSILLAGILLKLGSYGFMRFNLILFPESVIFYKPFIFTIAMLGLLFSVLTILRQIHLKRIIAYSSISHMSLVTLACFSGEFISFHGCILLTIAHGLSSSGLFACVGSIYNRLKTMNVLYLRTLSTIMPVLSFFFFFFTLCNLGFPPSLNFISELFILCGLFQQTNKIVIVFICLSLILGTVAGLWIYTKVFFGNFNYINIQNAQILKYSDINILEVLALVLLICLSLLLAVFASNLNLILEYSFIYNIALKNNLSFDFLCLLTSSSIPNIDCNLYLWGLWFSWSGIKTFFIRLLIKSFFFFFGFDTKKPPVTPTTPGSRVTAATTGHTPTIQQKDITDEKEKDIINTPANIVTQVVASLPNLEVAPTNIQQPLQDITVTHEKEKDIINTPANIVTQVVASLPNLEVAPTNIQQPLQTLENSVDLSLSDLELEAIVACLPNQELEAIVASSPNLEVAPTNIQQPLQDINVVAKSIQPDRFTSQVNEILALSTKNTIDLAWYKDIHINAQKIIKRITKIMESTQSPTRLELSYKQDHLTELFNEVFPPTDAIGKHMHKFCLQNFKANLLKGSIHYSLENESKTLTICLALACTKLFHENLKLVPQSMMHNLNLVYKELFVLLNDQTEHHSLDMIQNENKNTKLLDFAYNFTVHKIYIQDFHNGLNNLLNSQKFKTSTEVTSANVLDNIYKTILSEITTRGPHKSFIFLSKLTLYLRDKPESFFQSWDIFNKIYAKDTIALQDIGVYSYCFIKALSYKFIAKDILFTCNAAKQNILSTLSLDERKFFPTMTASVVVLMCTKFNIDINTIPVHTMSLVWFDSSLTLQIMEETKKALILQNNVTIVSIEARCLKGSIEIFETILLPKLQTTLATLPALRSKTARVIHILEHSFEVIPKSSILTQIRDL
jgi:proton-translocating NADH-quinone oxidoreductase chain M